MKYRPIAIEVIDRLRSLKCVNRNLHSRLSEIIQIGNPFEAFEILRSRMVDEEWITGWNKILRNGSIYGWYADRVTAYSLRLAVMEIESDDDIYESCRQSLLNLYCNIPLGNSLLSPKIKGVQQADPYEILQELGVNPQKNQLDKFGIALLHRLNLDMRERPLIESWHWSGGVASVVLTDGGKYQISRNTVWARAVEAGIDKEGKLNKAVKDFIGGLFSDTKELILPDEKNEECANYLQKFLAQLLNFRVAKLETDRVVFPVDPGGFPLLALKLWG